MTSLPPGTAPVKAEYVQRCISVIILTNIARFLLGNASRPAVDDDAAEGSTSTHTGTIDPIADTDASPGGRKKLTRQQKKAHRGANKGRRFGKVRDALELPLASSITDTHLLFRPTMPISAPPVQTLKKWANVVSVSSVDSLVPMHAWMTAAMSY